MTKSHLTILFLLLLIVLPLGCSPPAAVDHVGALLGLSRSPQIVKMEKEIAALNDRVQQLIASAQDNSLHWETDTPPIDRAPEGWTAAFGRELQQLGMSDGRRHRQDTEWAGWLWQQEIEATAAIKQTNGELKSDAPETAKNVTDLRSILSRSISGSGLDVESFLNEMPALFSRLRSESPISLSRYLSLRPDNTLPDLEDHQDQADSLDADLQANDIQGKNDVPVAIDDVNALTVRSDGKIENTGTDIQRGDHDPEATISTVTNDANDLTPGLEDQVGGLDEDLQASDIGRQDKTPVLVNDVNILESILDRELERIAGDILNRNSRLEHAISVMTADVNDLKSSFDRQVYRLSNDIQQAKIQLDDSTTATIPPPPGMIDELGLNSAPMVYALAVLSAIIVIVFLFVRHKTYRLVHMMHSKLNSGLARLEDEPAKSDKEVEQGPQQPDSENELFDRDEGADHALARDVCEEASVLLDEQVGQAPQRQPESKNELSDRDGRADHSLAGEACGDVQGMGSSTKHVESDDQGTEVFDKTLRSQEAVLAGMSESDRKEYRALIADLTEKEGECLNLLHCLYDLGRFSVPSQVLMKHLDVDWEQYAAIAGKMRAIGVVDLNISPKRATPHTGGLFIKSDVMRVWYDFSRQEKE